MEQVIRIILAIGMAGYEKQVQEEFHTPSLYFCFFMDSLAFSTLGVIVKNRTLVALVFHNLPSLQPSSFAEMISLFQSTVAIEDRN